MTREENELARDRQISIALRIMKQGRQYHTREWTDEEGRRRCYDDVLLSSFFNAINADIESITITSRMFRSWADLLFGGVDTMLATVMVRNRRTDAKQLPFYFYSRTSGTEEERQLFDKTTPDDLIIRISMKPNSDENSPSYYDPTFIRVIKDNRIISFGGTRLDYDKIERDIEREKYRNDCRVMAYRERMESIRDDDWYDDIDFANID